MVCSNIYSGPLSQGLFVSSLGCLPKIVFWLPLSRKAKRIGWYYWPLLVSSLQCSILSMVTPLPVCVCFHSLPFWRYRRESDEDNKNRSGDRKRAGGRGEGAFTKEVGLLSSCLALSNCSLRNLSDLTSITTDCWACSLYQGLGPASDFPSCLPGANGPALLGTRTNAGWRW